MFKKLQQKFFSDPIKNLLARGKADDDPRAMPNYLKIKNGKYDDVDWTQNNVDEIIGLTSDEFNELVSSSDQGLLLTFLSTLPKEELEKFYNYNDNVVTLADGAKKSAREQFEDAMSKIDINQITDEQRARATLEMPLMISFSKNVYKKINEFLIYERKDFYNYTDENQYIRFEATLSNIIYDVMKYMPDYFAQVITLFYDFYNKDDEEHKMIFAHLCRRFGLLIATLNRIVALTEGKNEALNRFVAEMIEYDLVPSVKISVSQTRQLSTDKKLINFLTLMFAAICDENEENYLSNLIDVVETLFEWYPVNRAACEYAMVEMMKSIALKKVSVENANRFLEFFENLPRFYEVLSFDKIMELKELINHTLSTHKPQNNEIFNHPNVKNKLILLNYFIDMEDLYYAASCNIGT